MTTKTRQFELAFVLTGPPGPVTRADDCPGYGQELPSAWQCQRDCPIANQCYAAFQAAFSTQEKEQDHA